MIHGRNGPGTTFWTTPASGPRHAVAALPEHLRPWCEVFTEQGIREASRELSVPRCRLQQIKAEIRSHFDAAGLADDIER